MEKVIVFIDGENFIHKIGGVITEAGLNKKKVNFVKIKLMNLISKVLNGIKIDEVIFYGAKLHYYPEFPEKSNELIGRQRSLKTELEKQGIKFIIAGNVRGQLVDGKMVFKEKGVDVKLAVDIVTMACDKKVSTVVLCSSDSDLQPAVSEARKRGVNIIYLGFELSPNKGLIATTNKTILFRTSEIKETLGL